MDPLTQALATQLQQNPHNWLIRAQLAEMYERSGYGPTAVQTILEAPSIPTDPNHLALGSRLLTYARPDLAMQYAQRLHSMVPPGYHPGMPMPPQQQGMPYAAMPPQAMQPQPYPPQMMPQPGVPAPRPVMPPPSQPGAPFPVPAAFAGPGTVPPPAVPQAPHQPEQQNPDGEIHLVSQLAPKRRRIGASTLTISILLHVVLLIVAGIWIIARISREDKKKLTFINEAPSMSANHKASQHDVAMAKKKRMSGAPMIATRIVSSAASKINLPENPNKSSFGELNAGMMSGLGGNGFGGGFGNSGGMGGGAGGGGGGGRIKFFGFEGDGQNIILAIDTSGSMIPSCGGPPGIAKLKAEIERTIQSLTPASMFNIICFGQQADALFEKSMRAMPENKKAAIEFMQGYYTGAWRTRTEKFGAKGVDDKGIKYFPLQVNNVKGMEGTAGSSRMDLALVAAFERQASAIFLLSDGKPTPAKDGKKLEEDDIIKLVSDNYNRMYKAKSATINTIYTNTDSADEGFLKKISKKFNGKHKSVKLD